MLTYFYIRMKRSPRNNPLLWEVMLKQFTFTDQLKLTGIENNNVCLNNIWYLENCFVFACCYISFFDYSAILNQALLDFMSSVYLESTSSNSGWEVKDENFVCLLILEKKCKINRKWLLTYNLVKWDNTSYWDNLSPLSFGAGNQNQGFHYARQVLYHWATFSALEMELILYNEFGESFTGFGICLIYTYTGPPHFSKVYLYPINVS